MRTNITTLGQTSSHKNLAHFLEDRSLLDLFHTKIAPTTLRGIDRVSPDRFRRDLKSHVAVVRDKCLTGRYRFTPYLESLRLKSRDRPPRQLAIATVRDRLALLVLKEVLHEAFPECVPRLLPNEYIRKVLDVHAAHPNTAVAKADIREFYPSIDHRRLLALISERLPHNTVRLIERAIRNPIVDPSERGGKRLRPLSRGVPQGLSISNILAEVYVHQIDQQFEPLVTCYLRYVDDILFFTTSVDEAQTRYAELKAFLDDARLAVSEEKHRIGPAVMKFDYLGYELNLPRVSVRRRSVDRFVTSLAGQFATYKYRADARYRNDWLDETGRKRVLLDELNERITGAISENRRYGWLFYFSEVTDLRLLYELDMIVRDLWRRYLGDDPPRGLKRFVRAFHETKKNQTGHYIHNYNRYDSLDEKLSFLVSRGYLDPASDVRFKAEDVELMFAHARNRVLAKLHADVGTIS